MKRVKPGRSSLLLMELALALMFFALCSAITLRVFATAKLRADASEELVRAVHAATTAAERYKAIGSGDMLLTYDENFTEGTGDIYTLTLTETDDGSADITVSGPKGEIYSMPVKAVQHG